MKKQTGLLVILLGWAFLNTQADDYTRFACAKNPLLAFNAATQETDYHKNCLEAALKAAQKVQTSVVTNTPLKDVNPNFAHIFKGWSKKIQDAYLGILRARLAMGLGGVPVAGEDVDTFNTGTHLSVGSNISSEQCTTNVSYAIRAALSAYPNPNCLKKAYAQITQPSSRTPDFVFSWNILSEEFQTNVTELIERRLDIQSTMPSKKSFIQLTQDVRFSFSDYAAEGPFTQKMCGTNLKTAVAAVLSPRTSTSCLKAIQLELEKPRPYKGYYRAFSEPYYKSFHNLVNQRLKGAQPDFKGPWMASTKRLFRFLTSIPGDSIIQQADKDTYGIDKPCPTAYRELRFQPWNDPRTQVERCFDACQVSTASGEAEKRDFAAYNRSCARVYQLALGSSTEAMENLSKDGYALTQMDDSVKLSVYVKAAE